MQTEGLHEDPSGDILRIIGVEFGRRTCPVRNAVEHPRGVEQLAAGDVALRLDATRTPTAIDPADLHSMR